MKVEILFEVGDIVYIKNKEWFLGNCSFDNFNRDFIYTRQNSFSTPISVKFNWELINNFQGKAGKIIRVTRQTGTGTTFYTVINLSTNEIITAVSDILYSLEEYKILNIIHQKCSSDCLLNKCDEKICPLYKNNYYENKR